MIFRLFVCSVFLLGACSKNAETAAVPTPQTPHAAPSATGGYSVVETFNVGQNVFVRSLAVDKKNNSLWVGTSVGAMRVDVNTGDALATYTRDNGLANEYVFAAYASPTGDTWLGTNGGGVSRWVDGTWKTYFPMHGLADYWVYSFAEQSDGTIWIGTWAGLNRFDRASGRFTTYLKELVNEWVYGLAVDSKNQLWIGTEGGVNVFDGKTWRVWTHKDGLGAANDDNLPFSTNTGLGTRSRHDLSVMHDGRDTYNPNYVFALAVDAADTVWAGTWGGGVSRFENGKWRNFTMSDGLAGNIVYSVAIGSRGDYWFGTNHGLSHYDGKSWQTFDQHAGLLDNHVYAIAVSPNGDVWAGTRHGVAHISSKKQ